MTLRVQQLEEVEGITRLRLSTLKTTFLNPVRNKLEGSTVSCANFTTSGNVTRRSPGSEVLVLDLQEGSCLSLLELDLLSDQEVAGLQGVLVLEAWRHLSSSPFPKCFKGQSLSVLNLIPSIPVVSATRLPDNKRRRFSQSVFLTSDPSSPLSVPCASLPCVNMSAAGPLLFSSKSKGLVRVVEVEQESRLEGSDQFSIKRVAASRAMAEVACREGMQGRNLSNLFCSGAKDWWREEKLSNYRCCQGTVGVFSQCSRGTMEGSWSDWSAWGECAREVGASRVEGRQRRFKVAIEEEGCLWVGREGRTCGEGDVVPRGACSIPDIVKEIPPCQGAFNCCSLAAGLGGNEEFERKFEET